LISSACQDTQQPSGTCDDWTYTYQCQIQPAQTSQQVVCTNGIFDTGQYPTPQNPNNTFVLAAVSPEILRQGQLYSDQGTKLFAGVSETCRKGYAGLQNCCKSAPGAMNNSAVSHVAFCAAASVVKYYGSQAIDWASPYVFDAMYNNGIWTDAMTSAFATGGDTFGTTLASSGFTGGAYGFSYSATFIPNSGLMGANERILSFGENGANGVLEFNPYALAAAIALQVVMSLLSCTPDEQMLAQHKGANLSVYEHTDCSQSFLGACLQYTDTYCSFNSVLAKIIQTQGKAQLGFDPSDCSGLSIAQVQQLDFTRIDFTEFTASITAQASASVPNNSSIQQAYSPVMQSITAGSAQTGSMLTTSNVTGSTPNTSTPPPNPALPTYPN
jgi:conjugal transfer mating pair stabilization protein TraN